MPATAKGFPYPAAAAANDVTADIQALADMLELWPGIPNLTQAQVDALSSPAKTPNLVVFNSTTGRLERWTGSTWSIIREQSTSLAGIVQTALTSYTPAIGDAEKTIETTAATAVTVTIPPNSSVAFPIGTQLTIVQYGTGQVSLAAGSGVTIRSKAGNLKLDAQYCAVALYKRGTNEWVAVGDLTA